MLTAAQRFGKPYICYLQRGYMLVVTIQVTDMVGFNQHTVALKMANGVFTKTLDN
jgi:hypothetical protein